MKILHYLLFIFSLSLIAYACTSDHPSGPESSDFDRQEMLKNWADNIIIPAFDSFKEETAQLKTAADGFTSNPTLETLNNLRATWETAYLSFQHVYMFEVGAAMNLRYHDNLNIYPADTEEIHKNIEGSYNLELPSLNNSQGFPALDYLLYGLSDADSELLSYYTTGENPEGYRAYLTDLTTRIDDLTGQVLTFWEEGFRNEFIENDGNGSNTSVDMMVNDYIFYYEKVLRAGKVGIPAGVFSGMPLSSHVEAYYRADLSKALLLEALTATQNFFNGKHFNSNENGESLSSYLDFL
ncbi:MAG: imelysin family protein, partial [Balneolaceae bacterium]